MHRHLIAVTAIGLGSTLCSAQNACDSLSILSVTYSPFNDTFVEVVVQNSSTDIFSYPGFILFDASGDTVAMESVTFFGIGGHSLHTLQFLPGQPSSESFTGHLELWTGFYDSLRCSFPGAYNLCPTDSCHDVGIAVVNFGGSFTYGSASWHLLSDSVPIASGTWTLDSANQTETDQVCLPPGHYTLVVDSMNMTGGQPYAQVTIPPSWTSMPGDYLDFGSGAQIDFDLYERCINPSQSVDNHLVPRPHLKAHVGHDGALLIHSNESLGLVSVYNSLGQVLATHSTTAHSATLPASELPRGICFVSSVNPPSSASTVVWIP